LLLERAKDVTEGIRIILHILDAFKCVIAVTERTANAASNASLRIFDEPNIFLAALPRIYPIGFPHQLMRAVTGAKKLPERGGAVIITPSAGNCGKPRNKRGKAFHQQGCKTSAVKASRAPNINCAHGNACF